MLFPYRLKNPPESFPVATIGLILTNILIFIPTAGSQLSINEQVAETWGLKGGDVNFVDMVASMFLHGDLFHLLGNMWFLYLFGFAVEGRLRTPLFLLLYFLSGFAGDFLHILIFGQAEPDVPLIGASGAIMGLMGAAMWMFPHAHVRVLWIWLPFVRILNWKMMWLGALYVAWDVIEAILCGGATGVANLAHIGGALLGFLIPIVLKKKQDTEEQSETKAILDEDKDYSLFSASELEGLYDSHSQKPEVVLYWMRKSLQEPRGPKPQAIHAFAAGLPGIVETLPQHTRVAGEVVVSMSIAGHAVPPPLMLKLAQKVEMSGDPNLAFRIYEAVLKQNPTEEDMQAAIFRGALICENFIFNFPRAAHAYKFLYETYPMGAFSQQARARLDALVKTGRVQV